MQCDSNTLKNKATALNNLTLLRNCLHALDVAPLRWSRRPMPWAMLLGAAPDAANRLPHVGGRPAISSFQYTTQCAGYDPETIQRGLMQGAYNQETREVFIDLANNAKTDSPQSGVITVLHEMAHALLHADTCGEAYMTDPAAYALAECQAELTALTAVWLLGYQLPASAFLYLHRITRPAGALRIYHAVIDISFETEILPAAAHLVRAFQKAAV